MTVDFTTPLGQVRLLATDITEPHIFEDDAIGAFLSLTNQNVKRAAALALIAIASDEVLIGKVIRTDDLQVSSHLVAEQLRKQAFDLNNQADADDKRELNNEFEVIYERQTIWPEAGPIPTYGRLVGWAQWR